MEVPELLDETTFHISRWSSGASYVDVSGNDGRWDGRYVVTMGFPTGSSLSDVVDCMARMMVGWAELGGLGVALAHDHIKAEGLCG